MLFNLEIFIETIKCTFIKAKKLLKIFASFCPFCSLDEKHKLKWKIVVHCQKIIFG